MEKLNKTDLSYNSKNFSTRFVKDFLGAKEDQPKQASRSSKERNSDNEEEKEEKESKIVELDEFDEPILK